MLYLTYNNSWEYVQRYGYTNIHQQPTNICTHYQKTPDTAFVYIDYCFSLFLSYNLVWSLSFYIGLRFFLNN